MSKSRVAIVKAAGYDRRILRFALEQALTLVGGWGPGFGPGRKIFVKINHLSPFASPDEATNTHPDFTRQVLELLRETGADITLGDDVHLPEQDAFLKTGYRSLVEELGIQLINLKETGFREIKISGRLLNSGYIAKPVLESDAILNLPKLKTHSLTVFTGAVKNMFGVIPGGLRMEYHRRFFRRDQFSEMLVDLYSCVPPALTLMDAVTAMEGLGPSAGVPRQLGLILAGRDGVAVDAVASRIIGLDPLNVDTTLLAHERGLGKGRIKDIEIRGENIKTAAVRDFKSPAVSVWLFRNLWAGCLLSFVHKHLVLIPEIRIAACTGCFRCVNFCPTGALRKSQDKAWIHRPCCIHCLCCHEACPSKAVRLRQSFIGRMIQVPRRLYRLLKELFEKS